MLPKIELKEKNSNIAKVSLILGIIWIVSCIFGGGLGGSWGSNATCYKYLGCTSGFFGYDAIEHFLFGIFAVWALIWIFKKFPKYSLLHTTKWKNFFTLIMVVVFISVLWEFTECAHDFFRLDILRQPLINIKLHINLLDQPTNLDTMGDMAFALLGSIVSLSFVKKKAFDAVESEN